jgi:ElaB/YqjD/DUF883 family membrane-anchored ribosome-binding protein
MRVRVEKLEEELKALRELVEELLAEQSTTKDSKQSGRTRSTK